MPKNPPGPKGLAIYRYLRGNSADRLMGWQRLAHDYGDLVYGRVLGKDYYLLNHPDLIKAVLVEHNDDLAKIQIGKRPERIPNIDAMTDFKQFHRQIRALLQPAFQPSKLAPYIPAMTDHTARWLQTLADGDVVNISEAMTNLTLTIVGQALFSADVSNQADSMGASVRIVAEYLAKPPAIPLPTPRNLRVVNAWYRFDREIKTIINKRRELDDYPQDLLSVILQAADNTDGFRLTDEQAHNWVIALFVAGHETTAIALAWTFDLLARHPDIQTAFYDQIRATIGENTPTAQTISQIPLADFIVREAMRLYPPAWAMVRQVAQPFEIGGYTPSIGAILLMSPYIMGRDARFFDAPEVFNPNRWADDNQIPRYAYFPFGGGAHVCIGQFFAILEASLIVTMVVQKYHIQPVHPQPPRLNPMITLHPAVPIHVRVQRRS